LAAVGIEQRTVQLRQQGCEEKFVSRAGLREAARSDEAVAGGRQHREIRDTGHAQTEPVTKTERGGGKIGEGRHRGRKLGVDSDTHPAGEATAGDASVT
jgi:hypothetical protein